jgi:hypothetical protein
MGIKSFEPKATQTALLSSPNTNETNVPETTAKSEVPVTEVNDAPSQTSGSTVVRGSSVPSNDKYFVSEATTVTCIKDDVTLHTVTS